jgi:hypothetical protein
MLACDFEVSDAIVATHTARLDVNYMAVGQAWGDYNNDGHLDLYLTNGVGANTLYTNQGHGSFAVSPFNDDVSLASQNSGGAVFGDFDNDGWDDIYVSNFGANTLFRNLAGQGFEDVTAAAEVGDLGRGESASWGDFNGDGFLDLFVTNWICVGCPGGHRTSNDKLYMNDGDGTFTDVTSILSYRTGGAGFIGTFVDYDNDQDLDIYVVNDKLYGNLRWRNDGPSETAAWTFTDVSVETETNTEVWGMGLAVGDYDNDQDLDYYFSNIGPTFLLQNPTSQGETKFNEVTDETGTSYDATHWGSVFFDYNNDGHLDIFLAVSPGSPNAGNRLYENNGDGTFNDISNGSVASDTGTTFGVAYADYDSDGWLDLAIANYNNEYKLLRNTCGDDSDNHWLSVSLDGTGNVNRDGIGGRVYLELDDGRTLMQEVKSGSSLGAGNQMALHFGLGEAAIQQARIVWPDGRESLYDNPPVDQQWSVAYPLAVEAVTFNETIVDPPPLDERTPPTSWHQQRSDLRNVEIRFNQDIDFEIEDIELICLGVDSNANPPHYVTLDPAFVSVNGNTISLEFSAFELPDGVYGLNILPSLSSTSGAALDGNEDGLTGDAFNYVGSQENGFYKLASDYNGDGGISVFDFTTFGYWFGQPVAPGLAPAYVDLNKDGGVSVFDFTEFSQKFGDVITFPTAFGSGQVVLPADSNSINRNELDGNELDNNDELTQFLPPETHPDFTRIPASRVQANHIELDSADSKELEEIIGLLAVDWGEQSWLS